jgi:hypothetical protein
MPFSFSSISIICTQGLKLLCVYVCTVQLLIQDLEFKRIGSKTISHSTASHVSPHCILVQNSGAVKWPGVRIDLFVPLTSEIWILAWHVGRYHSIQRSLWTGEGWKTQLSEDSNHICLWCRWSANTPNNRCDLRSLEPSVLSLCYFFVQSPLVASNAPPLATPFDAFSVWQISAYLIAFYELHQVPACVQQSISEELRVALICIFSHLLSNPRTW